MTCIVGMEHKGRVYIAGDLLGSNSWHKSEYHNSKVFKIGDIVLGYTSTYRFGQLLETELSPPFVPDKNIYYWLIKQVVPEIYGILKKYDEKGGTALIGVRGELYCLQDDYSILRSVNGYASVGSGYEYALGSLHTQIDILKLKETPSKILPRAIESAGSHSPSVGTKHTIVST